MSVVSSQNGNSPTAIEIDGIVFDMNRITRKEYSRAIRQIQALSPEEEKDGEPELSPSGYSEASQGLSDEDFDKIQQLSGQLYAKIITAWPFSQPITAEGYVSLGMMDSARVDDAFTELAEVLKEKKLARMSTYLPNTASPYPIPLQPTNTPA